MPLTPRKAPGPEPLKPPVALLGAGLLILLLIGGVLWWVEGTEWSRQDHCLDAGGRWVEGACEGAREGG